MYENRSGFFYMCNRNEWKVALVVRAFKFLLFIHIPRFQMTNHKRKLKLLHF